MFKKCCFPSDPDLRTEGHTGRDSALYVRGLPFSGQQLIHARGRALSESMKRGPKMEPWEPQRVGGR